MWDKLKSNLAKIGFRNITPHFLQQLELRNIDYVKEYCEKTLPRISYYETCDEDKDKNKQNDVIITATNTTTATNIDTNSKSVCKVSRINDDTHAEMCFNFVKNLTKGSNSLISIWENVTIRNHVSYNINIKEKSHYVLKRCLHSDDQSFFHSFIDLFIHAVMYSHSITILQCNSNEYIVPLHIVTFHKSRNKIVGIMTKVETDMHAMLRAELLTDVAKVDIYYDIIYKVASWLKVIQADMDFVHFDLKNNNIFVSRKNRKLGFERDNLNIYIGDFGASRIKINNNILTGERFYKLDHTQFTNTRDLYHLIHTGAMFAHPPSAQRHMYKLLNMMGSMSESHIIEKDEKWHDIYKHLYYNNIYSPTQTLEKFHKLFPQLYQKNNNILKNHHDRIDNNNNNNNNDNNNNNNNKGDKSNNDSKGKPPLHKSKRKYVLESDTNKE